MGRRGHRDVIEVLADEGIDVNDFPPDGIDADDPDDGVTDGDAAAS